MALSYSVSDDNLVIIKSGTKKIDEVGPWDSAEGADAWASAIVALYETQEYAGFIYPNSPLRPKLEDTPLA